MTEPTLFSAFGIAEMHARHGTTPGKHCGACDYLLPDRHQNRCVAAEKEAEGLIAPWVQSWTACGLYKYRRWT